MSLFGNFRMFWPRFIDLDNFILIVRTVSFFRKIIFNSSYTEENSYFLLYELMQDLPYQPLTIDHDCQVPVDKHSSVFFYPTPLTPSKGSKVRYLNFAITETVVNILLKFVHAEQ